MSPALEKKIHVRLSRELHRQLQIRCAELGLTIQNYVVRLLEGELGPRSAPSATSSSAIQSAQPRPGDIGKSGGG